MRYGNQNSPNGIARRTLYPRSRNRSASAVADTVEHLKLEAAPLGESERFDRPFDTRDERGVVGRDRGVSLRSQRALH